MLYSSNLLNLRHEQLFQYSPKSCKVSDGVRGMGPFMRYPSQREGGAHPYVNKYLTDAPSRLRELAYFPW